MTRLLVSVVVPTRNSGRTLAACLTSLRAQSYPDVEVIVVDNSSGDDTVDIATALADRVLNHGPERAAQRNLGLLQYAAGNVFGYIDSDMILGPRVLSSAVEAIAGGTVGVYVPEVILARGAYGAMRRFERSCYDASPLDAVRFFRSEDFKAVGGFDEALPSGTEDWDLDLQLKSRGSFAAIPRSEADDLSGWVLKDLCKAKGAVPRQADAIYHDESGNGFREFARKKAYYAAGFDDYRQKWGNDRPEVVAQFGWRYRLFGAFFGRTAKRAALMKPHLYALFVGSRAYMLLSLAVARISNRSNIESPTAGSRS